MRHRGPDSPHTQIAGSPGGGLLDRGRAMHQAPEETAALDFLTPAAPAPPPPAPTAATIAPPQHDFSADTDAWHRLSRPVRAEIDRQTASEVPDGWTTLAVELTGFIAGNATTLARHEKMSDGDGATEPCHFVIGNGDGAGDGEIQPTLHWRQARVFSDRAIRIRLVADLSRQPPTRRQWEALDELVDYLRVRTGHLPLTTSPALKPLEAALR